MSSEGVMRFETRQSVELCTEKGLKLLGVLHLPQQEPPFPAVLMIHGLAGTKSGRNRLYVRLAEKLSQKGIASLRMDMRGCGDSEGDYTDITVEAQVQDCLMALDFLAKHPLISKESIGVLGRSMGGAIAVLVAEQMRKKSQLTLSSVALWCPLFSAKPWLEKWQKSQDAMPKLRSEQGIPFQGGRISMKLLTELFALNLLPALQQLREVPFFFAHSVNDPVVAIEQTHHYLEQRTPSNEGDTAETRFRPFYGKDHEFSSPEEQVDLLEESVQWFQHSLCGPKKSNCVIQKS